MTLSRLPRRILLVGGGGREHALAWKLAAEPGVSALLALPGSAAIAAVEGVTVDPSVRATDPAAVLTAALRFAPDLVVIGPEAPLAVGVGDALRGAGYAVFGPGAAGARIESSKAFCHAIAAGAGIAMARAGAFPDRAAARAFAADLVADGLGVVVKADGLAAGKGVMVCDEPADIDDALDVIFAGGDDRKGLPRVVIEERLGGPEASVIALCDGIDAVALPAARDHKRLRDGDRGPNTGGMGAYSPLADVPDSLVAEVLERFHRPVLAALARRGIPFRGALYAGLMLTPDRGPMLLEFNARFGDPETQAILPRMTGALGPLLMGAAEGRLAAVAAELGIADLVPAGPDAAVSVVLASRDYPSAPSAGDAITGIDAAEATGALVFHAGTRRGPEDGWETDGGRILAVTALGADLAAARAKADAAAGLISFEGVQRRRDIGGAPGPAGSDEAPAPAGYAGAADSAGEASA